MEDPPQVWESSRGWRRMVDAIPSVNDRSRIEAALRSYVDSWGSGEIEARLSLFANDVVFEDPATVRRATGKAELASFFGSTIPRNWKLSFWFDRVVVVGDEAVLTYRATLRVGDAAPAELLLNAHVQFDAKGLISSFRTFFDADAITDDVAPT